MVLDDQFPATIKLTDSKKLTAKQRESLEPIILEQAFASGLGWVPAEELDRCGLSAALKLATRRAVKAILAQISTKNHLEIENIIIDGTVNFLQGTPLENRVSTMPKADLLVREVSAASIIAKVARDRYMAEIALQYPAYGFEKHVGYGTALHKRALLEHGICPEHRQSFRPIREIIAQNAPKPPQTPLKAPRNVNFPKPPSTSQKGQTAELAVATYLKAQNHQILAHNFKTKTYEIDLISRQDQQIFFTEVKYSRNPAVEGTPLVRITPQKQKKMQFAAECFLSSHPEYQNFSPVLAAGAVTGPDYQLTSWFVLT